MSVIRTFPGFVDVHVHFRDPGVPEAEDTVSGLKSAARGGFAAVVTMPNTEPACDTPAAIRRQVELGEKALNEGLLPRRTRLFPSASITKGRQGKEVADLEALAEAGAAFFTDDGSFVEDGRVMEEAMRRIAELDMTVSEHALTRTDGVIRECALAKRLGLPVIPVAAETEAIRRDLALCRETGCRLHIQHISTAEGVELVRGAQREGLPVTAEATPHHLLLACDDLVADDANFKMAPPLGNHEDRAELRRAVKDGVLLFATDHAPHPAAKKSLGFLKSANGIVGLETAIAITYTVMVKEEGMEEARWAEAWWKLPRFLVRPLRGAAVDALGETRVVIGAERPVEMAHFATRSRNAPYAEMEFDGWPMEI